MNDMPMFDTFWMASVFIESISVLPQLALTMKTGGVVKALTSHYIMALAVGRVLSGVYMLEAKEDMTCDEIIKGFNHAPWAVLGAHVVHLLLLADFAWYYFFYVCACMRGGQSKGVEIGNVGSCLCV